MPLLKRRPEDGEQLDFMTAYKMGVVEFMSYLDVHRNDEGLHGWICRVEYRLFLPAAAIMYKYLHLEDHRIPRGPRMLGRE
ncbi:MAG: hypothetical protein WC683_11820 [bacterium]